MRKSEKRFITIGLVLMFAAIGWYAYGHQGAGPAVLLNLNNQSTQNTTAYALSVSNISAIVDQATGHVKVSFSLANARHFNISSVEVLYALNVKTPENANYTAVPANANDCVYTAEIPSNFGDTVYYKVKVVYGSNETLETSVSSILVKDITAPAIANVALDLVSHYDNATNTTSYSFNVSINATDNDKIASYTIYYADLGNATTVSNTTNFTKLSVTSVPATINVTAGHNYAFYFVVEDVSGNKAMLYNETAPLIVNANTSATWPQTYTYKEG